ncbi:MAG: family 43 glycosylhydrolase [Verrucomicrobiales bacterium]|nr:family 43 glycosylhydrolase [Verrucomicrobiales bacterium]MCP5526884.1 family 43 glycosylhydrolase [Verrucomicrobiales bacterium]
MKPLALPCPPAVLPAAKAPCARHRIRGGARWHGGFLPILLLASVPAFADQPAGPGDFPLALEDIRVRDPFIHADPATRTYFLYAQTGNRGGATEPGVEVYRSRDLEHWSRPTLAFRKPAGFWGGKEVWAPEMHRFGDQCLLFVSFNGREGGRGTQILHADHPGGPFTLAGPEACTPSAERALDGTPFIDPDGTRWMVYCHEWVQIGDGAMRAVRMTSDWSARQGDSIRLFNAREAPWVRHIDGGNARPDGGWVTDGPGLLRTRGGKLLMLWSSFGDQGYAVGIAESASGRLAGPWTQRPEPLFAGNGGHCMVFDTFDGRRLLALHQPNTGGRERTRLFDLIEFGGQLTVRPYEKHAGYLFAHLLQEDYGRLYYSLSTDGLHWQLLNDGQRIEPEYLGHPDLTRGPDGRFYLVGNQARDRDLRIWVSEDLVRWRPHRDLILDVSMHPGFGRNPNDHGAPKIWYDEAAARYVISWHSSRNARRREAPEHYWAGQRTFYITSPDLESFTEPRRLFGFDLATIDVIIRREGSRYFAFLKDERYPTFDWPTGKTIRISSAPALEGPWTDPGPPITPNFHEAPTLIPRADGQGWWLYYEQYPAVRYGRSTAPTLAGPWYAGYSPDHHLPPNARHGCMVPLNAEELRRIQAAFSAPQPAP